METEEGRKKRKGQLTALPGAVIILAVIVIILAATSLILQGFLNQTGNTSQAGQMIMIGQTTLSTFGGFLPTIAIIVVMAVVIAIILGYFMGGRGKGRGVGF